jgi:beta-galactosidase
LLLDECRVANLTNFVERGGHLVLTIRSGMKDCYNALLPSRQPGPLAALAGVEIEDYYALLAPIPVKGNWFEGTSQLWAERLCVIDSKHTRPLARFGVANGWLDDQLAISVHSYEKGLVYFIGAYLDPAAQQALTDHWLEVAGLEPFMTPANVEVGMRVNNASEVYLIVNHERLAQTVTLPWPAREHLSKQVVNGEIKLPPYGVAILTKVSDIASQGEARTK